MRELIDKSEVEHQIQNRKRQRSTIQHEKESEAISNDSSKKSRKTFHQEKPIAMEYDDSEKKIHSKLLQKIFHQSS